MKSVHVATWNLGTRWPTDEDFKSMNWLELFGILPSSSSFSESSTSVGNNTINSSDSIHQIEFPDLLVIGFQELLSQAIAFMSSQVLERWSNAILDDLNHQIQFMSKENTFQSTTEFQTEQGRNKHEQLNEDSKKYNSSFHYTLAGMMRMTALGIMIFQKQYPSPSSNHNIQKRLDLSFASVGSGLAGVYGNKGCVGVSIEVSDDDHDTIIKNLGEEFSSDKISSSSTLNENKPGHRQRFCFLNCHLTAHEGDLYFRERNEEFQYIFDSIIFDNGRTIDEHDAVWIFGDFNYRLSMSQACENPDWVSYLSQTKSPSKDNHTENDAKKLIKNRSLVEQITIDLLSKKDYSSILKIDELNLSLNQSLIPSLKQFKEAGRIEFRPTYKFEIHEQLEEFKKKDIEFQYSKKRIPAYCDRIIYSNDPRKVEDSNIYVNELDTDSIMRGINDEQTSDSSLEERKLNAALHVECKRYHSVSHGFSDHHSVHANFILTSISKPSKMVKQKFKMKFHDDADKKMIIKSQTVVWRMKYWNPINRFYRKSKWIILSLTAIYFTFIYFY